MSGAGLGHASTASLLLAAGAGYLLAPSGQVYSGPLTGAAWRVAGQAPNAPGAPGPDGQPTSGLLAAGSSLLFELCTTSTEAGGRRPNRSTHRLTAARRGCGQVSRRLPG